VQVVFSDDLNGALLAAVAPANAHILLVDLDDEAEQRMGNLYELLDQRTLPVLFNDASTTERSLDGREPAFGQRLLLKLLSMLPPETGAG